MPTTIEINLRVLVGDERAELGMDSGLAKHIRMFLCRRMPHFYGSSEECEYSANRRIGIEKFLGQRLGAHPRGGGVPISEQSGETSQLSFRLFELWRLFRHSKSVPL